MSTENNNARVFPNPALKRVTERNVSRERQIPCGHHLHNVARLKNTHVKNTDFIKVCELRRVLASVTYCLGIVTDA